MIAEKIQIGKATEYGGWSVRWPLRCRMYRPCREYDIFRENKEKRNDSHNMGNNQAFLPKLGKKQEPKSSPNFAVRVGTSHATSSCPRPFVVISNSSERISEILCNEFTASTFFLCPSFMHVRANNFQSMYTLGFSTVLFRGTIRKQRAG